MTREKEREKEREQIKKGLTNKYGELNTNKELINQIQNQKDTKDSKEAKEVKDARQH